MKIAENLEETLRVAFEAARQKRYQYITVEHLLLALLDDVDAQLVLIACAANIETLRQQLVEFTENNTPIVKGDAAVDTQPTLGFQRVIQRAIMHVQAFRESKSGVNGANCLMALYGEKDSHAVFFLHKQEITRLDVVNFIAHGIRKHEQVTSAESKLVETSDDIIQIAVKQSSIAEQNQSSSPTQALRVFVSYSHVDSLCLERLLVHLKPLQRGNLIDCWSDKNLRTGDKWQKEIEHHLKYAAVAVLLISADFLASEFIVNDELPPLLIKAESSGLRIIPLILKPCGFLRDRKLSSFQAVNDPAAPLLGLSHIEQERIYNQIASDIHDELLLREKSAG
jgi:hypothetical protein